MSRVVGVFPGRGLLGGPMPRQQAPLPIGGSPASIEAAYNQAYNSARGANEALYNNILGGYRQTMADQTSELSALQRGYPELASFLGNRSQIDQDAIRSGYGGLGERIAGMARTAGGELAGGFDRLGERVRGIAGWGGQELGNLYNRQADIDSRYDSLQRAVMGDIEGLGRTERLDLQERYGRERGRAQQDLISRGFGNASVARSAERGIAFDEARANIALGDRLARERADYRSQLGLAGLAYRERAGREQNEQARFNIMNEMGAAERTGLASLGVRERFSGLEREALERSGMAGLGAYERAMADSRAMQERLGLARLGFGERAVGANTGLALNQLNWMNTVSAGYPNPQAYANLAAMAAQRDALAGGGGGGLAGGGMGPTGRGGPWTGDRLTPGGGGATLGSGFGSGFGPGGVRLNAGLGVTNPGGPYGIGGGYGSPGGGGLSPGGGISRSPYAPPDVGFGGGWGAGPDPDQFDLGGNSGMGLVPGGGLSQNPYFAPRSQQPVSPAAPSANPYAPATGGFGGGTGGAAAPDWANDYLRLLDIEL